MKYRLSIIFLLVLILAVCLFGQQATVQEEKKAFKTYPFSGPDPAPIMTRSSIWGKGPRLYPYFFFDKLSNTGADRTWNVVRMENPYIRVFILPAEGGKLIGAIEKSTDKQFIYFNQAWKFPGDVSTTTAGVNPVFFICWIAPAVRSSTRLR